MRFIADLLNIDYELEFAKPKIRLADFAYQTLEHFYNIINPSYPLELHNLLWLPGGSLTTDLIQVSLFNTNGVLRVHPEKFVGRFTNLKTKQDIEIIVKCILLCEEVLTQAFPETEFRNTVIKTSSWLKVEGGETAVETILQKGASGLELTIDKFNATGFEHGLRAIINNQNEKWSVEFLLEKSTISDYDLFFILNTTYFKGSEYNNLDKRADHIENIYTRLLSHFGLDRAQQPEN